jgi:hypothetical protein
MWLSPKVNTLPLLFGYMGLAIMAQGKYQSPIDLSYQFFW